MRGSVRWPGFANYFEDVRVSRSGAMPLPHFGWMPNVNITGLAYDGFGQLWGSAGGFLRTIGPPGASGGFTAAPAVFAIPGTITDLASAPQCIPDQDVTGDVGDAPDSTNHPAIPMTAYTGVSAAFPVVYDVSTGSPQGPIHWVTGGDSWLGAGISDEFDADQLPDSDGLVNIDPNLNASDRDGADDGVVFPVSLPQCAQTQLSVRVRVVGATMTRYVNAWIDFNRDGDWADTMSCVDGGGQLQTVSEWVAPDVVTNLGMGAHNIATPSFWAIDPGDDTWLRVTLAEAMSPGSDGRGANEGFEIGETEDYLLHKTQGYEFAP